MKRERYFTKDEKIILKAIIQEKTGYFISSDSFLCQAFRRRSYCAEDGGKSNELFEFIGDSILSYYVVKIYSQRCGSRNYEGDYSFRIRENQFTSLKQELINNEKLAKIIDEWEISEYLIVGKSDEQNHINNQIKVKADLFESIIGAIAVDSNWDSNALEKAIENSLNINELVNSLTKNDYNIMNGEIDIDNAISKLKELAEKEICSMPKYDFAGPEHLGYDKNGSPIWSCICKITNDQTGIIRGVFSHSKKDAKKAAAYLVLCEQLQIQNKYGKNGQYSSWYYGDGNLMPDFNKI